jgi:DNA repair protein RadC
MIISEKSAKKASLCSSQEVAALVNTLLASEDEASQEREHFYCIGLNTKNVVKYIDLVSLGSLTASLVHPRETFRVAVTRGAAAVIFSHNHPSGDTKPSQEDILLTRRLSQAGDVLGIKVLDHVIVGEAGAQFSFRDNGMIEGGLH